MKAMEPARDSLSPALEYLENYHLHYNYEDIYSSSLKDTDTIKINSSQSQNKSKNKKLSNAVESGPKCIQLPKLETKPKNTRGHIRKIFFIKRPQIYVKRTKKKDKMKPNEINQNKEIQMLEIEEKTYLKLKELN
ncbi:hypothetical protein O181_083352 [Austropuccinia psidii MF-1]|uniref:Uncharacterized protein n=1 Tax=Austropuccinia psidii MF-1 TaxID=1389203 RepID=A0A9Q3FS68_9BASI|nr:hypothetical protein [Austropuccinia psidii MF-1]